MAAAGPTAVPRVSLADVVEARARISDVVTPTPVLRLDDAPGSGPVWLKLETLQPIGSMKLRGVLNAVRAAGDAAVGRGLVTVSSGNLGRAVAWTARMLGAEATVVVPSHAPDLKVAAIEALGARVKRVDYDTWWRALLDSRVPGVDGHFIHPVLDADVIAGAGTVALEVLEQVPDVATIVVPFGGGSLAIGSAVTVREARPSVGVMAVEPDTAAPLTASFAAGADTAVEYRPSFVDAAGGKALLPGVWQSAQGLLAGSVAVSLREVEDAVRTLARRARTIAEGAGALSTAAVYTNRVPNGTRVCVVSGGNIDLSVLAAIYDDRLTDPV